MILASKPPQIETMAMIIRIIADVLIFIRPPLPEWLQLFSGLSREFWKAEKR